jgi:hypothetical protein
MPKPLDYSNEQAPDVPQQKRDGQATVLLAMLVVALLAFGFIFFGYPGRGSRQVKPEPPPAEQTKDLLLRQR